MLSFCILNVTFEGKKDTLVKSIYTIFKWKLLQTTWVYLKHYT